MKFIDTHTHLYSEAFDEDRDLMIERAINNKIEKFMIPAIDSTYTDRMLELKQKYPERMFLMTGLHPTHVKADSVEKELGHVKSQLALHDYCAVGEIGIDLYWDKSTLAVQQEAFAQQIRWAKEYDLPIVIHCRDAFDEVFEVLEAEKGPGLRGIFHCFTGNYGQALQALSYDLKLGIGGVVTFKNGKIDTFLDRIDIKHLVLETDSPYLAPAPFRGKRNESSYLLKVAEKVAEIYGLPLSEIGSITSENAKSVFKLD